MDSLIPQKTQQLALQFLQTSSKIDSPQKLAEVRMDASIPRYGSIEVEQRLDWLKDQILILYCLKHIAPPDPFGVLVDTQATDEAIMADANLRCLTLVEIQDAFKQGIHGAYGDFFGITSISLAGFLRGYQKSEKWQTAKAIVYKKEKEREEEAQRRLNKELYSHAQETGFEMPFWKSNRNKKDAMTPGEREAHRLLIEKQRQEIYRNAAKDRDNS